VGQNGTGAAASSLGGRGGNGKIYSISGTATYYAGGGGGGGSGPGFPVPQVSPGGLGGGGASALGQGSIPSFVIARTAVSGNVNTGGGGGGGHSPTTAAGGFGGSGIVIIKVLNAAVSNSGANLTIVAGANCYTFTTSGNITF
jgi:hypothetical protein